MEGAPKKSPEGNESANEAGPKLEKAKAIFAEMQAYDYQDIDRETHTHLKELNAELHKLMMDSALSWRQLSKSGLPWDPRFEMYKQMQNKAEAA